MIRVFPSRTKLTPIDPFSKYPIKVKGEWQMPLPFLTDLDTSIPVRVSCTFSWDKPRALWLAEQWASRFSDVELGGPAFDDPGGEFEPNRYVGWGAVITSRGCPRQCDFCLVPKREGQLRELEVKAGWNVLDNNLLACSEPHLDSVFNMLARQPYPIKFSGGLEAGIFRTDHLERLLKIRVGELWFAADSEASLEPLMAVGKMLDYADVSINKRRCYVLFDPSRDSLYKANRRAELVLAAGFLPFAQTRREEGAVIRRPDKEWADLNRYWSRPAIYRNHLRRRDAPFSKQMELI